jgi:hypothetical protein
VLLVDDATASVMRLVLTASDGREIRRTVRFSGTARRALALGPLPAGRYAARIAASDSAGHSRTITRVVHLRP